MLFNIGYVIFARSLNGSGPQSYQATEEVSMFKALLKRPFNVPARSPFPEGGGELWITSLHRYMQLLLSLFLLARESG